MKILAKDIGSAVGKFIVTCNSVNCDIVRVLGMTPDKRYEMERMTGKKGSKFTCAVDPNQEIAVFEMIEEALKKQEDVRIEYKMLNGDK